MQGELRLPLTIDAGRGLSRQAGAAAADGGQADLISLQAAPSPANSPWGSQMEWHLFFSGNGVASYI
jgi:hypothetical protein